MTAQSRSDIQKLLDSVAPILRLIGVPEQQINISEGPNYKVPHYLKAYDWLHDFTLSSEMAEWKKTRLLRPEEVWENYVHVGVEGLAEQVLLEKASKKLLKRWRQKRPRMFGPNREKNDAESDGSDLQPDQNDSSELCIQTD